MVNLLSKLLNIVFPPKCLGCGKYGDFLCKKCRGRIRPAEEACVLCHSEVNRGICLKCANKQGLAPMRIHYAADYRNPIVEKLIKTFKYRSARVLADVLGEILLSYAGGTLTDLNADNTYIIPVPISDRRRRERGFNQSELLAKYISNKTALPLAIGLLIKNRHTATQVTAASREERLKNLYGSFSVRDADMLRGKTAVLVDDVITTGATILETARVLKAAGARQIIAIAVAH